MCVAYHGNVGVFLDDLSESCKLFFQVTCPHVDKRAWQTQQEEGKKEERIGKSQHSTWQVT